jgi:hypothetical protein
MEPLPRIADVLAAKPQVGKVPMALAHSFLSYTWSASYVRLVEFEPAVLTTIPVVLAHALWADPSMPEYTPEEWLPNVAFVEGGITKLREFVAHAISDLHQSSGGGDVLVEHLRSLDVADASAIYELAGTAGGPRPSAPRQYGPTYQTMWQSRGRFFFLEVHNES